MFNLEEKLAARREGAKERLEPKVLSQMLEGTKNLKDSGLEEKVFNVGDKIGNSVLLNNLGKEVEIVDLLGEKPAIITFYRGTWCPYCNLELAAYNEILKEDDYINLFAISPELPESATNIDELNFTVLSDVDNKFAKSLNLTFELEENIGEIYKGFGIDLEKSQGNDKRILPVPVTYILDGAGVIIYAFIDTDYTRRAEPQEVIDKYKELFL